MTIELLQSITSTIKVLTRSITVQKFIVDGPSRELYQAALELRDALISLLTELDSEFVLEAEEAIEALKVSNVLIEAYRKELDNDSNL